MKKDIIIFSDGASKGNPGSGGFGAIVVSGSAVTEIGGREKNTTNNRMELAAAISALSLVSKTKEKVLNKDLWEKLAKLSDGKKITWNYVGGHIGVAGNERSDEIASDLASGLPVKLYKGDLSSYPVKVLDIGHDKVKKASKSGSKEKAYSYLSLVDGVVKRDLLWADCEKRVKGVKNTKYKKAISAEDEIAILKSWGINDSLF